KMLALHLQLIDALEHALTELDAAVGLALTPIRQHVQLLKTIRSPYIVRRTVSAQ
ncbi:MAG: transposase, partial [Caballeronia sp.]|nr:transposase [Caballeronia sp.]